MKKRNKKWVYLVGLISALFIFYFAFHLVYIVRIIKMKSVDQIDEQNLEEDDNGIFISFPAHFWYFDEEEWASRDAESITLFCAQTETLDEEDQNLPSSPTSESRDLSSRLLFSLAQDMVHDISLELDYHQIHLGMQQEIWESMDRRDQILLMQAYFLCMPSQNQSLQKYKVDQKEVDQLKDLLPEHKGIIAQSMVDKPLEASLLEHIEEVRVYLIHSLGNRSNDREMVAFLDKENGVQFLK